MAKSRLTATELTATDAHKALMELLVQGSQLWERSKSSNNKAEKKKRKQRAPENAPLPKRNNSQLLVDLQKDLDNIRKEVPQLKESLLKAMSLLSSVSQIPPEQIDSLKKEIKEINASDASTQAANINANHDATSTEEEICRLREEVEDLKKLLLSGPKKPNDMSSNSFSLAQSPSSLFSPAPSSVSSNNYTDTHSSDTNDYKF